MAQGDSSLFAQHDETSYQLSEDLLAALQTPALVVYMDRVRDNVERILAIVGGADRWRPHLKTTKIPEVWTELLRAGVHHFKCATTREAAIMLDVATAFGKRVDLLVAYPHRGPSLRRLGELAAGTPSEGSVLCPGPR